MILIDCSVLIDHFRIRDPKLAKHFVSLPIGICGVTRFETLAGARFPKERAKVIATINSFQQVHAPEAIWDKAAEHQAIPKSKGVNVPFPDLLLATLGIDHDLEVWARDQHFRSCRSNFRR